MQLYNLRIKINYKIRINYTSMYKFTYPKRGDRIDFALKLHVL